MSEREGLTAVGGCREGIVGQIVRTQGISPVHFQDKRVRWTRIGDGACECGSSVFIDASYRIERDRRCHVVDRDRLRLGDKIDR